MDVQLQELIDKIKKDGVAAAEASAADIVSDAKKKADKIVSDAETKAGNIIKAAKAETERMEKASEDAIGQAGRNLIISFRDSVTKELSAIVQAEIAKAYSSDVLAKLIPEIVKSWTKNVDAKDVSVLLGEKDLAAVEKNLRSVLKDEISKGLELKADKSIDKGFRVGINNGEAYYDFSADAVADLFSAYLNPRTAAIMKKAVMETAAS